jgi:hypothetical protein
MKISLLSVDEIVPWSGRQSKTRVKLVGLEVYMEMVVMHEKESRGYTLRASSNHQGPNLFRCQRTRIVLERHVIRFHGGSILPLERIFGGIGKEINVGSSEGSGWRGCRHHLNTVYC